MRSYRGVLALAVVLWHRNVMHRTWHPTPSRYTDTRPTCHCVFHWCGTSQWNTQLTNVMFWVRPDREILPKPSTHTPVKRSTLWCCYGGCQSEAQYKVYRTHWVLNPGSVVCEYISLSTRSLLLLQKCLKMPSCIIIWVDHILTFN